MASLSLLKLKTCPPLSPSSIITLLNTFYNPPISQTFSHFIASPYIFLLILHSLSHLKNTHKYQHMGKLWTFIAQLHSIAGYQLRCSSLSLYLKLLFITLFFFFSGLLWRCYTLCKYSVITFLYLVRTLVIEIKTWIINIIVIGMHRW